VKKALVDTSVFLSYFNRRDPSHLRAAILLKTPGVQLVTIWPIVWETITLACRRVGAQAAADVGERLLREELAEIVELTSRDHSLALTIIRQHAYLKLSAADASACALVRRLKIGTVLSFDSDFGTVLVDRTILGASDLA
jgi:predicted nucleic acid-binding protein